MYYMAYCKHFMNYMAYCKHFMNYMAYCKHFKTTNYSWLTNELVK